MGLQRQQGGLVQDEGFRRTVACYKSRLAFFRRRAAYGPSHCRTHWAKSIAFSAEMRQADTAAAECGCCRSVPLNPRVPDALPYYLLLPEAAGGAVEGVVVLPPPDVPDEAPSEASEPAVPAAPG